MPEQVEILGIYDRSAKAAVGARAVLDGGLGAVVAYAPVPDHALDRALHVTVSPIRLFVLIGGLLGCATGFVFPIYTVLDWPLITGGRPLISIPPFVVIAFELTILFAAVSGMAGFLLMSRLPRVTGRPAPDARFTNDMTGVSVSCAPEQSASVRACLERTGAHEIRE
ncbi:MAG: hypothetical protein CL477_00720 [Acidobacteria bacterium]|jgi:hypothetical protein|nr:hypothetical protein [Acidobacteriota bacterium]MDP7338587.1 DUF3341 domain-containing protein [Vicinamibacterales bacterium]MDP7480409.1 DUF3341 domain-containing protein [Vicinamibacterales bacterium]MDP7690244.1 DUF3341 domain-containing protein [Vicinamibacterales bacterium]HJN45148.1 DUF3341 domain-containing protein [Vicinamibacterales bacterium]